MASLNHKAFSAIELIAVLFLSSLLFLLSLPALKLSSHTLQTNQKEEEHENTFAVVKDTLRQSINNSQSLLGFPAITIHPPGHILYTNQTDHAVHLGLERLRPEENSNAISFLELHPELLLKIVERSSTNPLTFLLCHQNKTLPSHSKTKIKSTKHFLAIGIDGTALLSGKVLQLQSTSSLCVDGVLFQGTFLVDSKAHVVNTQLSFFSQNTPPLSGLERYVTALVPVEDCYTLYLDREGSLRRVSDLSSENQPLVSGISKLLVSEKQASSLGKVISLSLSTKKKLQVISLTDFSILTLPPQELIHLIS